MTRPLRSLAKWLSRLGGAVTGDVPHRFATDYPWHGCWCDKPEDNPVHWGAERALAARRETTR